MAVPSFGKIRRSGNCLPEFEVGLGVTFSAHQEICEIVSRIRKIGLFLSR